MPVEIDMPKCYRFLSRLVRASLLLTAFFAAAVVSAGVELRSKTTIYTEQAGHLQAGPSQSGTADLPRVESTVTLAHAGSLRIDIRPGSDSATAEGSPQSSTIFRGAFEDFLVVDHPGEAFTLIDDAAIEDLEARLQFTMLHLDRRMAELPPEQRKRMREALAAPAPQEEPKIVPTQRKAKKGGLECQLFEFRRGDELVREVWVAPWEKIAGGPELKESLEKLQGFSQRLEEAFSSIRSEALGGAQIFQIGSNPFEDFERLGGLPMHTIDYQGGQKSFETAVEAILEKELTQGNFLVPDNYRRRSLTGE